MKNALTTRLRRQPARLAPLPKPPAKPPARPRKIAKPKPLLPVDALYHPALDRQPAQYLPIGPVQDIKQVSDPDTGRLVWQPTMLPNPKRKQLIRTPDRDRQRGPEALLALFGRWRVELRLVNGELLAYGRDGGMPDGGRKLLEDAAPLLRAHLAGDPLRCGFPHRGAPPVALTLAAPSGVPICQDHLDGKDPDHAA